MKKFLLGLMLGIFILKASHTYYDYEWWTAEASLACRIERDTESGVFPCIYRKMGYAKYLEYVNVNLAYTCQTWQWRN